MKKKILLVLSTLLIAMSLCSCGESPDQGDTVIFADRFEFTIVEYVAGGFVTDQRTFYLIRDLETGFAWLYDTEYGTLSPLDSSEADLE